MKPGKINSKKIRRQQKAYFSQTNTYKAGALYSSTPPGCNKSADVKEYLQTILKREPAKLATKLERQYTKAQVTHAGITAHDDIKDAFLVLDPGWAEGYTVNGLAPQPLTEASRNGRLAYGFGHIPAGQSLIFFMSLQVNPTNIGRRSQNVELDDGETPILTIHRNVTIFP